MPDPTDDTTPQSNETDTSPWSVEHYGFTGGPVSEIRPPAEPRRPRNVSDGESSASPSHRRHPSARVLATTGALALGLVAGVGGLAVGRTSTGDGQTVMARVVDEHHDHNDGGGGGDGRDGRR